jgi:hypothetical protein
MQFDGQKGEPLSFSAAGELKQPLLIVVDGKLAGVVDSQDLDSVATTECK